jgi:hypothetical protein
MVAGAEACYAGRGYYHGAQRADNDSVVHAKPVVNDLRSFFSHKVTRPQKSEA